MRADGAADSGGEQYFLNTCSYSRINNYHFIYSKQRYTSTAHLNTIASIVGLMTRRLGLVAHFFASLQLVVVAMSAARTPYRLFGPNSLSLLGPLQKPVAYVLNTVGDLLRIQGDFAVSPLELLKLELVDKVGRCSPNGLSATISQKAEVSSITNALEALNPTKDPAYSPLMDGFWRLLYTDFTPASTSSGKLGPFVGDVFQDLNSKDKLIKNILQVNFPPIKGALIASIEIENAYSWRIVFDRVGNSIAGLQLPTKKFLPRKEIRIWEIVYLDTDLRILRARRPESNREDSFIFVLKRDEGSRVSINI